MHSKHCVHGTWLCTDVLYNYVEQVSTHVYYCHYLQGALEKKESYYGEARVSLFGHK